MLTKNICFLCIIFMTSLSYADNGHQASLITITAPSEGSSVAAGSSVTVTAQPLDNVSLKMVTFIASGDNPNYNQNIAMNTVIEPPYTDTIKIPATNFIGNLIITVMAVDAQGNYDTQKRKIQVISSSNQTLQSISLNNDSGSLSWAKCLNFFDAANHESLVVNGTYSDGVTRDITLDPKTIFNTSDPSVATVDNEGHVSATGNGSAQITVTNSGVNTQVSVKVAMGTPRVMSVFPQTVQPGASIPLVITGDNLGGTSQVVFFRDGHPDPYLKVRELISEPNGTNVRMTLRVDPNTPPGKLVVVVTTRIGRSSPAAPTEGQPYLTINGN